MAKGAALAVAAAVVVVDDKNRLSHSLARLLCYLGLKYGPGSDETAKLLTRPLNEQLCQIVLFLFP